MVSTRAQQSELAQYRLDLRDLIGLLVHRLLGQGETQMVGQSRQQVDPRSALLEPRSVLPSRATAASPTDGAAGVLTTTPSAQAPNVASNASRSTCRKTVCSVAAQGVLWVKPSAWAIRPP